MTEYSYDNKSLLRNGHRWFPVMGEIHYSRYPEQYWKEALLKMKAGGVDIVSSYVFWIHHEEVQNEWNWSGQRDLRRFVQTVQDCGMVMFLRVGPWCHGEVRNGGFPDWLCAKHGKNLRTNDKDYLQDVDNYFKNVYEQVKGLFLKDGGPIIGIQVENEYGHCGGLTGEEGEKHMKTLTKMLKEHGFDAPLYTATGWGGAVTVDLLPVMGGYCDAPWDPRTTEIEPSGNFVFTYERNDHNIGSDYGLGEGTTFDMDKVPYLTAELGGGLQMTYKRRTVPTGNDIAAMSIAKMGSGCSLLGYYMYHGGTNPDGKLSSMQETTATGSFCDLLEKNYDFQAPLGEYGNANDSYRYVRRLALFVHDYGEELAEMDTYIPEDNPIKPDNFTDLRYALRFNKNTGNGFLFINNYQRHNELLDHYNVHIHFDKPIKLDATIDVKNGDFMILPVKSTGKGSIVIDKPILCELGVRPGKMGTELFYSLNNENMYHTLSCEDSLNSSKITLSSGKDVLIISSGTVYSENIANKTRIYLESFTRPEFRLLSTEYLDYVPAGFKISDLPENTANACGILQDVSFVYTASLPKAPAFSHSVQSADNSKIVMFIHIDEWPVDHFNTLHDVFLDIAYVGNCARLYLDDKLVADDLFTKSGHQWHVGLRKFGKKALDFRLEVDALNKNDNVYIEEKPNFASEDYLCGVYDIGVRPLVRVSFDL